VVRLTTTGWTAKIKDTTGTIRRSMTIGVPDPPDPPDPPPPLGIMTTQLVGAYSGFTTAPCPSTCDD
jgi:hypothetical protein